MRLKHNISLLRSLHKDDSMAYVLWRSNTMNAHARAGPCWGLSMLVGSLLSKIRAHLLYHETVRELSPLPDRELHDLGIARRTIRSVARQAAVA